MMIFPKVKKKAGKAGRDATKNRMGGQGRLTEKMIFQQEHEETGKWDTQGQSIPDRK